MLLDARCWRISVWHVWRNVWHIFVFAKVRRRRPRVAFAARGCHVIPRVELLHCIISRDLLGPTFGTVKHSICWLGIPVAVAVAMWTRGCLQHSHHPESVPVVAVVAPHHAPHVAICLGKCALRGNHLWWFTSCARDVVECQDATG